MLITKFDSNQIFLNKIHFLKYKVKLIMIYKNI